MKNLEIYLDMDGVLADFDGKIMEQPELAQMRTSLRSLTRNLAGKLNNPYGGELHFKDVEGCLRGPQSDPDLHRLKQKLKFTKERIFQFASKDGFFLSLEKLHDADELVDTIIELTKKKPHILSAPLDSSRTCREDKRTWIETYFGNRISEFHLEKDKFRFARPNRLLIDDTPKKIRPFIENGGLGIIHTDTKSTLEQLKQYL